MRLTVPLIRAEVQTILVLAQIVRCIDIAEQWHFAIVLLSPCCELRDFFGKEILVAHHHHRHRTPAVRPKPLADALRVVSSGIDDIVTSDIAVIRVNNPLVTITGYARCGTHPHDLSTQITRSLGHRLGQLCRINIAVQRVPQAAREIMRLGKRMFFFDVRQRHDFHVDPLISAHPSYALKLLHTRFAMCEAD